MSPCSTIFMIRHGEVYNPNDLFYGRLPRFKLSNRGRRQAAAAGRFLADIPLAAVYSSPLLRTRQTAAAILSHRVDRLRISKLIIEVHTPFDGLPARRVDQRKGDVYSHCPPQYEQPPDIFKRSHRFCRQVLRRHKGGVSAAVTHGDVLVFTLAGLHGKPLVPETKNHLAALGITNGYPRTGSIIRLDFDAKDNFLQSEYIRPESETTG